MSSTAEGADPRRRALVTEGTHHRYMADKNLVYPMQTVCRKWTEDNLEDLVEHLDKALEVGIALDGFMCVRQLKVCIPYDGANGDEEIEEYYQLVNQDFDDEEEDE